MFQVPWLTQLFGMRCWIPNSPCARSRADRSDLLTLTPSSLAIKNSRTDPGWWFGISILFSQKYWECHHPNWRSYFSEGWPNHQPGSLFLVSVCPHSLSIILMFFFRHNMLNQGWCLCGSLHFFEETSMFVWDTETNGTVDNCKYPNRWVTTCLSAFITVFVAFFATRSPCKRGRSPDDMNLCVPCSLTQDRLGSEVASAPWVSDWIRKPFRLWAGPRGNKSMEFRGYHRENRCFADHPFVVSNQRSKMF